MTYPTPDPRVRCPYSGFDPNEGQFVARCADIVAKCTCPKFVHLRGEDPNIPGKEVDHWGCIDSVQHKIGVELGRQMFAVGAELSKQRNEDRQRESRSDVVIGSLGKVVGEAMRTIDANTRAFEASAQAIAEIVDAPKQLAAPRKCGARKQLAKG